MIQQLWDENKDLKEQLEAMQKTDPDNTALQIENGRKLKTLLHTRHVFNEYQTTSFSLGNAELHEQQAISYP